MPKWTWHLPALVAIAMPDLVPGGCRSFHPLLELSVGHWEVHLGVYRGHECGSRSQLVTSVNNQGEVA